MRYCFMLMALMLMAGCSAKETKPSMSELLHAQEAKRGHWPNLHEEELPAIDTQASITAFDGNGMQINSGEWYCIGAFGEVRTQDEAKKFARCWEDEIGSHVQYPQHWIEFDLPINCNATLVARGTNAVVLKSDKWSGIRLWKSTASVEVFFISQQGQQTKLDYAKGYPLMNGERIYTPQSAEGFIVIMLK